MTLSDNIKKEIEIEFNHWTDLQYAGKDKKDRQTKGQFFTPPPLTIKMLEKFDSITDKDILDPTVGAAGLLAAAVIAGADPNRVYGIELDPDILRIAQRRLLKLGVPPWHLQQGDALDPESYKFDETPVPEKFAVIIKNSTDITVDIVINKKLFKEVIFNVSEKDTLKRLLVGLSKKNIKLYRLAD